MNFALLWKTFEVLISSIKRYLTLEHTGSVENHLGYYKLNQGKILQMPMGNLNTTNYNQRLYPH